ncbi:MAG: trpF [Alphaproteobacteria bacterium]|nr:trpF [Alphaproteobacteria bacterium]
MAEIEGVLGEIVARKREDVARRFDGVSIEALRASAEPSRRSLRDALALPGARFVMEVKRASPSEGSIRAEADPAATARAYTGAADAISVLTDTPYFGGSLADLEAVRSAFDGPILAKDFVIDPRQVVEARIHGADAILVMLSVLDDSDAATMIAEAARLGMDALVETHDEAELERALALGASIIGINNRDLKSLKVDLAVTERLAPLVPEGPVLIAESGIANRFDVERLAPLVDAFLVGSSLMRAPDPGLAARALVYGRVKVCGLTDPADAAMAQARGAAYAGVIMVPNTPRARTCEQARSIAQAVTIPLVGVFRNEKPMQVAHAARTLGLAAVQLHGEEDALYIRGLRQLLPEGTEIWAADPVGAAVPEPRLGADRMLYDSQAGGRSGGTGIVFDWSRIAGGDALSSGLLAGGLDPDNAALASRVGAFALDVCSGVEAAPGRKDPARLAAFFDALRPTSRKESASC